MALMNYPQAYLTRFPFDFAAGSAYVAIETAMTANNIDASFKLRFEFFLAAILFMGVLLFGNCLVG